MADDITKKILIDVKLKQTQLKTDVTGLNSTLDELLAKQFKLSSANKQNTAEYVGLQSQIRLTKAEIKDANKQIDNITKATNAENNSLQQNRALLSVLTAQYAKLSLEEGKTAQSTLALGKTIDDLTTKLKTQEKQIGQTYRNVGNYEEAFKNAFSSLGDAIPGFQRFNTAITTVVKGFGFLPNAMNKSNDASAKLNQTMGYMPSKFGDAAKGVEQFSVKGAEAAESTQSIAAAAPAAEEGIAGLSAGMIGMIAAIAAIVVGIVAIVGWFAKLTPNAEALKQQMSGVGAAFSAFMSDLGEGVGFGQLADDMSKAYSEAKKLTAAMQDLNRAIVQDLVDDAKADEQIAELQLKMRNRRNTPAQEKQYFDEIQKIATDKYKGNKELADKQYELVVLQATNARKFSEEERDAIMKTGMLIKDEVTGTTRMLKAGIETAAYLDKTKGLRNKEGAGTDIQAIANAQLKQTQAEREFVTVKERAQNRLDAIDMKAEQAAEKELALIQKIKEETAQSASEKVASISRTLAFQQEAFGKELSTTNEHYRQLIFKQEQFVEKQRQLANTSKSGKVRAAASKGVSTGLGTIAQLQAEQYIATEQLLVEHNKVMVQEAQKGALELKAIHIAGIEDVQKREIAAANNDKAQRTLQLDIENQQLQDNIRKLNEELTSTKTKYSDNEIQALKTTLNEQLALLGNNSDKRVELTKETNRKIDQINKQAYDQQLAFQDKTAIFDAQAKKGIAGGKNNPFNADEQSAKHQQLLDEYNAEVSQKGLTDAAKLEMEKAYLAADFDLTQQNEHAKMDMILQFSQVATNAAFSIFSNSLKSQAQTREVQLGKDKDRELANSSLTSAQKISINDKYRKLEGQEKVKEFKADQKLSLAKAAIETAMSILKASPIIPLMALAAATGAAEIGVIASQKPPAYATGGFHKSDGRGALLPGYSRHDNVNAQLRSGEAVVVSEAMKDPWARNLVSAINVRYGGRDFSTRNPGRGYAIGGIVTDGGNSNRYYAQPQEGTQNLANSIAFSLINNFPPVVVDVKDINNQQSIKAKTVNRVNL